MQYILMDYVNEAGWPRSRGRPDPRPRFAVSSRFIHFGTAHC
jgi:hypothetical protein